MQIPSLKLPSFHGTITTQLVFVTDTVEVTRLRHDTIYVPQSMPHYVLSDPQNAITKYGSRINWTTNHSYEIRQYSLHSNELHID